MISTINTTRVGYDSNFGHLLHRTLSCHDALINDTPVTICPEKFVVINISGKRFKTFEETLDFFPDTLLGNASKREKFFNKTAGEYFFDRHRRSFAAILYYYQSRGLLIQPDAVPVNIFYKECLFFQLPDNVVEKFQIETGVLDRVETRQMPTIGMFKKIWEAMEYPDSSKFAKFLAISSVIIILASIVIFCLETLPDFNPLAPQRSGNITSCTGSITSPPGNITLCPGSIISCPRNFTSCSQNDDHLNPYEKFWFMINSIIIAWFTTEFVVRLVVCPNKARFIVAPLNIIDILSILPYYVTLLIKGIDIFYFPSRLNA